MLILGLSACQKDEAALPTIGVPGFEENVTPRVQAFVALAEHADISRDEIYITADSALWYVEAALNYGYTDISKNYDDEVVDTARFSVPITTDGLVRKSDATNAFNHLGTLVNTANVEGMSHVAIVDVDSNSDADSARYTATYVIGSGYDRGVPNTTFGPNDYWEVGGSFPSTVCGCGPNQNAIGACSDQQIRSRINFAINGGYYQYWTNVETWSVNPGNSNNAALRQVSTLFFITPIGPDNLIQGDWVRDFLVYWWEGQAANGCLSPTDMRFYTQGTWDAMQTIRNIWVSTKQPASCTIVGNNVFNSGFPTQAWHDVQFRYGKLAKVHP